MIKVMSIYGMILLLCLHACLFTRECHQYLANMMPEFTAAKHSEHADCYLFGIF